MERVQFRNGCHFFTACRTDRPRSSYAIDFGEGPAARYAPWLRHRWTLQESVLVHGQRALPLDAVQRAVVGLVDGRRTIADIAAHPSTAASLPALDRAGREAALVAFFRLLWNLDVVAIGIGPA